MNLKQLTGLVFFFTAASHAEDTYETLKVGTNTFKNVVSFRLRRLICSSATMTATNESSSKICLRH